MASSLLSSDLDGWESPKENGFISFDPFRVVIGLGVGRFMRGSSGEPSGSRRGECSDGVLGLYIDVNPNVAGVGIPVLTHLSADSEQSEMDWLAEEEDIESTFRRVLLHLTSILSSVLLLTGLAK